METVRQRALIENNKVQNFIQNFRDNNEYNPISIDEYNAKFKVEFNHFLENSEFLDETIKIFKVD